jgi:uncharacterized membrane protein YhhN
LTILKAFPEQSSSSFTNSHPPLLLFSGACSLTWVCRFVVGGNLCSVSVNLSPAAIAKCFVMALLYLKDPLPAADLEIWVRSESLK